MPCQGKFIYIFLQGKYSIGLLFQDRMQIRQRTPFDRDCEYRMPGIFDCHLEGDPRERLGTYEKTSCERK